MANWTHAWEGLIEKLSLDAPLSEAQDDLETLWARLTPREFRRVGEFYLTGFLRGCADPSIPSKDLQKIARIAIREMSAELEEHVRYEPARVE